MYAICSTLRTGAKEMLFALRRTLDIFTYYSCGFGRSLFLVVPLMEMVADLQQKLLLPFKRGKGREKLLELLGD